MLGYARAWLGLRVDRRGIATLEYALIASLIVMVLITAVTTVGTNPVTVLSGIAAILGS